MDLRALLFTSDGSSTATLCQVLTDLGIEAEICSEMLVAVERVSRENYDAIIVDWDLETEATFLLRTAREQKALGLNLALVPDDASIARALQHGANSVIKKPIDASQASETLSTARDLILSRRTEQRNKEARISAVQAETDEATESPLEEPPAPKSGFLPQSMSRSALEAEEKAVKAVKAVKPDNSGELRWQAARGPATLNEVHETETKEIQPVSQKRWDEVKTIFRETPKEEEGAPTPVTRRSQDSTGVFSSLPEEPETFSDPETSSLPSYLVFAMVACLLIAGVLYVWAPGDSYLGRVSSAVRAFSAKSGSNMRPSEVGGPGVQTAAIEKPATPGPAKAEDVPPDAGPIDSTDVDPSEIQIIEAKAIPKPGAQQPPTTEPPPDSDQAKAQLQPENNAPAASPVAPQAERQQSDGQPTTTTAALARPQPSGPAQENPPSAPDGRTGVIIPDSLKTTPAPSPASSLEPFTVPEETSLGLLIHRVDPDYPAQALQQHLEGPVVLKAWIGKDGSVLDLKLVKGYFLLGRAAFDAVKQWRFKPYNQNGKTIDFQTYITLTFKYPN
jgi:TonB family protein